MKQAAHVQETTHIPMTFRPRGGKTVIVLPDGSQGVARREVTIDNTMVKVIARGFRWQRLLFDGTYATIEDLADAEKINPSYVSRILRLAYLSPRVVQAILDGTHPAWLTMRDLMGPFPMDWRQQERHFLAPFRNTNSETDACMQ